MDAPGRPVEDLTCFRGAGGLVSALASIDSDASAVWVCAALSDADRHAARCAPAAGSTGRSRHRRQRGTHAGPRSAGCTTGRTTGSPTRTLWFVHHMLFDPRPRRLRAGLPRASGRRTETYNAAFADALAEEAAPGAAVLVQDYHLALAPRHAARAAARPADRPLLAHPVGAAGVLPAAARRHRRASCCEGMLGADRAAFLDPRWAEPSPPAARTCWARSSARRRHRDARGRRTRSACTRSGVGRGDCASAPAGPTCASRMRRCGESGGEPQVMLRVDRTELSKNIVRGLQAYRELLARPAGVARAGGAPGVRLPVAGTTCRSTASTPRRCSGSRPRSTTSSAPPAGSRCCWRSSDDFPRSLAAYRLADVLLVNPIRDGMNLVAKEGPVVSDSAASAWCCPARPGAAEELGADALLVNPYDVTRDGRGAARGADACRAGERARRCERLAAAAAALPPSRGSPTSSTASAPRPVSSAADRARQRAEEIDHTGRAVDHEVGPLAQPGDLGGVAAHGHPRHA